jgi:hypothetical protein
MGRHTNKHLRNRRRLQRHKKQLRKQAKQKK